MNAIVQPTTPIDIAIKKSLDKANPASYYRSHDNVYRDNCEVYMSVNVLYRTSATATGGRDGHARSEDGKVDVQLSTPK